MAEEEEKQGRVPFHPADVAKYLDTCIRNWRDIRDRAATQADYDRAALASHYVDTFQSVRASLFGHTLEE